METSGLDRKSETQETRNKSFNNNGIWKQNRRTVKSVKKN